MSKRTKILFAVFFGVLSLVVIWLASNASSTFMMRDHFYYLGGPVGNYFSPVEMVWWLFLFMPVWCGCGFLIDQESRSAKETIWRYGSAGKWWILLCVRLYGINIGYFFLFGLVWSHMHSIHLDQTAVQVFIGLMLHSGVMIGVMLWIFLWLKKLIPAFVVILFMEVLGKMPVIAGFSPKCNPLVWGMYGYSSDNFFHGFKWGMAVFFEVLFVFLVVMLPLILKKLILRGVLFAERY